MTRRRQILQYAAAASAAGVLGLPRMASAQGKYKSEYKMSLVVGTAFPWGEGGQIWADKVREKPTAASTSSSTPASRWCRVTRRASSRRCARA